MIADRNDICTCCSLYIPLRVSTLLIKVHPEFVSTIKAAVIVGDNLDCCRYTDNGSHFCKSCYGMIFEKNIPKFGSANRINVLSYQKYSNILSNLTLVKKIFIVRTHFVISIIKLRLSGFDFFALYLWGYTVVLLQNPGPLLTILPLSILAPHNVICIA